MPEVVDKAVVLNLGVHVFSDPFLQGEQLGNSVLAVLQTASVGDGPSLLLHNRGCGGISQHTKAMHLLQVSICPVHVDGCAQEKLAFMPQDHTPELYHDGDSWGFTGVPIYRGRWEAVQLEEM